MAALVRPVDIVVVEIGAAVGAFFLGKGGDAVGAKDVPARNNDRRWVLVIVRHEADSASNLLIHAIFLRLLCCRLIYKFKNIKT